MRPPSQFEQFVLRVHRRLVIVRALEQGGLGLLMACLVALPLTAILIGRGEPGTALAATALGVGAVVGIAAGMIRRPTRLAAASEADRQLRLADLLSTAWSVRQRRNDPWVAAVLTMADAKAASLMPSAVLVNRFGGRAWGGIGLAAALVFALALVPTAATESRAGSTSRNSSATALFPTESAQQPIGAASNNQRRFLPQPDPQDEPSSRRGATDEESSDAKSPVESDDAAHRPSTSADPTGHGTGASQSKPPPRDDHPSTPGAITRGHHDTGESSAGAGDPTPNPRGSSPGPFGTSAGPGRSNQPPPPWHSDHWPGDAREALRQAQEGRIPDRYHDVMRGYFDPTLH